MAFQQVLPTPRHDFRPLGSSNGTNAPNNSYNMKHSEEIPMTKVPTHNSTNWNGHHLNNDNSIYKHETLKDEPAPSPQNGTGGRRKLVKNHGQGDGKDVKLNAMGRFYDKVINFSVVTRYAVYVIPVAAILAIPIAIGATTAKDTKIGGMRLFWFFLWIEIMWLSCWIAKLFAQFLPYAFVFLCGVVSPGTRKYALILQRLEIPLSLVGWAVATNATFSALSSRPDNDQKPWMGVMKNILGPALIASLIYLAEKLIIQLISISYHQRSFDGRIATSKRNIFLLGLLYEASRSLFPMYCQEFEDEDYTIAAGFEAQIRKPNHKRSGSATPMRLLNGIVRAGDKVTGAFGNIASEITGKQVFNPNSAHSIVIQALEKKNSAEALAKRIWMSFVVEGAECLSLEDIREVMGPARRDEADEAFESIDVDGNGDISLDEMILKVVDMSRERKAIAKSMHDIGGAISVLDSVLVFVVFIMVVFVFVAFLNANFVTTLATAGTTLLSLSFVFAVTCQEFLGSCIFLFIKHPYDVGDRVDIQGGPEKHQMVVMQISLLYTVFKRIDSMKIIQVPNIVLNTTWIENVSRSTAMKEQLELSINFDTTLEDIELLRTEMEAFVKHPDNARDFQPELILECTGFGTMDKLLLKAEIRHKSNWSNETIRAARRSKFMCALVLALRKVPIYGPGGGGKPLGDPLNPTYSVAVTDEFAAAQRDKWTEEKEGKRLVPTAKPDEEEADKDAAAGEKSGTLATTTETAAATSLNNRPARADEARDDEFDPAEERRRSHDIEELRDGLMKRQSTRGRRRADMPLLSTSHATGSSVGATVSSPLSGKRHPQNETKIDEEAELGSGNYYGQPSANPAPAYSQAGFGHGHGQPSPPGGNANPFSNSGQVQGGNMMPQGGMGQGQGQGQTGGGYNNFPTAQGPGFGGQQGGPLPPRK